MLQVVKDTFRLLTFRLAREEILNFGWQHLVFGLVCTWLVGIGRYWDNPRADFLQHLGIGSVVYIFVLSLFLWLTVLPLKTKDWTYFKVLTFVSLVSPPAILYAIPVQNFYNLETANSVNAIFLLVVAAWRVGLLLFFLRKFALLDWFSAFSAALFPLAFIVAALTILNLDRVVFDFMAGIIEQTPNDAAYGVLGWMTFFSILSFPVILIGYIVAIIRNDSPQRNANSNS